MTARKSEQALTKEGSGDEVSARDISSALRPKKLGRPPNPEGRTVLVAGRVPPATADAVDAYARKNAINRSEAVWRLIEQALAKGEAKP